MNNLFNIRSNSSFERALDVELLDSEVCLVIPHIGSFSIDNLAAAEKLRDILNAWITVKQLEEDEVNS